MHVNPTRRLDPETQARGGRQTSSDSWPCQDDGAVQCQAPVQAGKDDSQRINHYWDQPPGRLVRTVRQVAAGQTHLLPG